MKDARKKVLALLKLRMADYGYRLRPREDLFWRTQNDFTNQWQARFLSGARGVEVDPEMGIRSEAIERIFHQTSSFAPEHHAGTSTIGGSLANLEALPIATYRCPVTSDDDVLPTVERLMVLFEGKAQAYFARYGSLQAIDQLLNDRPSEPVPGCGFGLPRETRGLIVARLVGRANYLEILTFYRARLAKLNIGSYLAQFDALATSLSSVEPEYSYAKVNKPGQASN
jgi:hypothetical protein